MERKKRRKKKSKSRETSGDHSAWLAARLELDSHADTTVFGSVCLVTQDTGKTVNVEGYDLASGSPQVAKVATCAVAYDCPYNLGSYVLFFHQALYMPHLENHLVNPFQMREGGVDVQDVPLQHVPQEERTPETHTISVPSKQLIIPLSLRGTMSGFTIRKPTWDEVMDTDEDMVTHVHMTSEAPWDPTTHIYGDQEEGLRLSLNAEYDFNLREPRQISPLQVRGQDSGDSQDLDVAALDEAYFTQPMDQPVEDSSDCQPKASDSSTAKHVRFDKPLEEKRQFDPQSPTNTPMRTVSSVHTPHRQGSVVPLDVDSFAESLLLEEETRALSSVTTRSKRKGFVSPEGLAKNWGIGLETAKMTIAASTQRAVRDFTHTTGGRRLKPYAWVLGMKRISGDVYTDTLIAKCKSIRGNKYCQIYVTPFHFMFARPIKLKEEAHLTLTEFFQEVGIPNRIIPDNAKEMTEGLFKKKCAKAQCRIQPGEPHFPNFNLAETGIREAKRKHRHTMTSKNVPEILWDYCFEWVAKVRSHTAMNLRGLDGKTPATMMTGDTCDISHLAEFGFYDWVWFITPSGHTGHDDMRVKRLGKCLGPSDNVGSAMCASVFTEKASVVHRSSIIPLTVEEENSQHIARMKEVFEECLKVKLKDRIHVSQQGKDSPMEEDDNGILDDKTKALSEPYPERVEHEPWSMEELGYKPGMETIEEEPVPELKDADDLDFNSYIAAKVKLPRDGHTFANAQVIGRAKDECGDLIGKHNQNPLLDTSVYEVKFDDGAVERYTANIIAENIYSQVDKDGVTVSHLHDTLDHKTDETAVPKSEGTFRGPNGTVRKKQTTRGWSLLVELKNGSAEWFKLKDLKESNPIEVAQCARARGLMNEPAFAWWAPWTLKQMTRTLKAMKTRYLRTESKFGIELPKTVKRALEIDKETGTTYWADAIAKELKTVMVAFEILPDGSPKPVGRGFLKCHMVFDLKQTSLIRKARFVADGSRTPEPTCNTYASVVSRDSVRLAFLIAALNDLEVMTADLEGAYLNAKPRERLHTRCGPEFGECEGRYAIIVRAIYGCRTSASSWRSTISKVIEKQGFDMCRADNDVWMRKAVKADGTKIWEYVLVYSDDLLVLAMDPEALLNRIDQHFKMKDGSVGIPEKYLGADIGKFTLNDGNKAWYMSSESYVKAALDNVEAWLKKRGDSLKTKAACVFPSGWKPELDVTDLLKDEDASYFQQQIGVLRWMVELGRIDILTEVSMLAAYSVAPRAGHMAAVLHLCAYLKQHKRSKLVFDFTKVDHDPHPVHDWEDFYSSTEVIPSDKPEERGESIQTTCFVDSDHAGDLVSRRSRTGVLIFCNRAPIMFYSKKQGSIEGSSFGSEFSAMKTAVELVEGLRYKLRMMGVPLDGGTHIKADNMSVIHNCSKPASTLKKKSVSIAYHYCRERIAGGVCSVTYVNTLENLADMFTKSQPGIVRRRLVEQVLY